MGMDIGGPSAMTLYSRAGAQAANPDTGLRQGAGLVDAELAARTHYATPSVPPERALPSDGARVISDADPSAPPAYYNYQGGMPVKYDVPSAQKERMQARSAIRKAAAKEAGQDTAGHVQRVDPITDDEVSYLQSMQDQAELAKFDRYVNALIDPRKPGNLKWLMEIYPEFVERRIQQVHTDYQFALRNQMIDSWGINTFDDLHHKYMVDQGKIDGPRLGRHTILDDSYSPGVLSPWAFAAGGKDTGLFLPFASAQFGRRPPGGDRSKWKLSDEGQPLAASKGVDALAESMYKMDLGRPGGPRDFATGRYSPADGPSTRPATREAMDV